MLSREVFDLIVVLVRCAADGATALEMLRTEPNTEHATIAILTEAQCADEAWVELQMSLVHHPARQAPGRRRIAQELGESEERFRRLSEVALDGMALHEDGVVLEVNQALASMVGYDRSEMIGRPWANSQRPSRSSAFYRRSAPAWTTLTRWSACARMGPRFR